LRSVKVVDLRAPGGTAPKSTIGGSTTKGCLCCAPARGGGACVTAGAGEDAGAIVAEVGVPGSLDGAVGLGAEVAAAGRAASAGAGARPQADEPMARITIKGRRMPVV